jgi:hypothetical protein
MNTDNTQGGAEPSSASAGSHEKPAIETMTSQERFNSAVMGWISEATEAIEGSGAVSDSAKRLVDEMRCQCGDAYQAMFSRQATHPQPTLTDEERADLNVWLAECLRQCSTATEGGESDLAERWQGRARRAAAMIERLGDRVTRDAAEPSGASAGSQPVPPAYATALERRVMERFLRVFDSSGGRFACGLVGTPAMDIRFLQEHPTREDADFCCYMLAKAIVFCGQQVRG